MKIIHVFTHMNYVYTEALINLFSKHCSEANQVFFICDKQENLPEAIRKAAGVDPCIRCAGTLDLKALACRMIACIEESDYTVFHFLPNNIYFHALLSLRPRLYSKIIWRIWGADLYHWRKEGIEGLLLNRLRGRTRKRIGYVIAYPMDKEAYIKQFGNRAMFIDGPNPVGYDVAGLEHARPLDKDDCVNILLGHSAVKTLGHQEMLDRLWVYRDNNIRIHLPMNYGDPKYAKEVYDYAVTRFSPEKIHLIREKLNISDYMKLLWKCDIAIIHSDRQIAMGNITMLMYMRKKLYLKRGSVMDRYYREQEGLQIYDSNTIGDNEFDVFAYHEDSGVNRDFAIREIDENRIASAWKKTYQFFVSQCDN